MKSYKMSLNDKILPNLEMWCLVFIALEKDKPKEIKTTCNTGIQSTI